jgi:hypothetical protein
VVTRPIDIDVLIGAYAQTRSRSVVWSTVCCAALFVEAFAAIDQRRVAITA